MPDDTFEVEIFGSKYRVGGEVDSEAYIKELAQFLDQKMREVSRSTQTMSSTKVAVLAALNIADELLSLRSSTERTEKEVIGKMEQILSTLEAAEGGERT